MGTRSILYPFKNGRNIFIILNIRYVSGFFFPEVLFCWLQGGQRIKIVGGRKSTIGWRKNKVYVNIGVHGYCVPNNFKTACVNLFIRNTSEKHHFQKR